MNKIKNIINNVARFISFFLSAYRSGGYAEANISQIKYNEILRNKHVLITGGSSGIGYAIAEKFISEGARVVIVGRDLNKLKKAKKDINSDNLTYVQWDISDISKINEKIDEVNNHLDSRIDVLINNAGILFKQDFFSLTEDIWDKTYAINSKSVYFISKNISSIWIQKKQKGKIINISSTSGFYGTTIPYGMTKWDIVGLTKGLGKSLYQHGIIVNGIAPGRTATAMLNKANNKNIYDPLSSAKRYCLPEEIAELAMFLISDASNFIVGQTIICDGGYTLK